MSELSYWLCHTIIVIHIYFSSRNPTCPSDGTHLKKKEVSRLYKSLFLTASFIARIFVALKGHWQRKISTFRIKVFNLNIQNVVVWCYENARNTFQTLQKCWPWRHVLVNTWRHGHFLLLYYRSDDWFSENFPCSRYSN